MPTMGMVNPILSFWDREELPSICVVESFRRLLEFISFLREALEPRLHRLSLPVPGSGKPRGGFSDHAQVLGESSCVLTQLRHRRGFPVARSQ